MKRLLIDSPQNKLFQEAWELYLNAFPIDERRELDFQAKIMNQREYHFELIYLENVFVGFIAWWQFNQLRFVEHFATLEKHRGKGYGKLILQNFLSESNEQIILEVEHPNTDLDLRRIGFYQRIGFKLNPFEYQQLPLRKNGKKVDLQIMSYPELIEESTLNKFEKDFKEKCYNDYFD
ncbi:MAG TPA: GNAT family N-acetyltransferase [Brumimicrobium sp.]|nr:GNAT family N-acetyltransferase [Brumimicrobium sp.]